MSFFTRQKAKKSSKNPQIGISENHNTYCIVHFLQDEPTVIWQEKTTDLTQILQQAVGNLEKFTIIRAVPHHYVWRKMLFFPANLNEQAIYRQLIQILKQELPIPLEEIYFDYCQEKTADGNSWRVQLFALRKTFADPLILNENTILDCELHCAQRGFEWLMPEQTAEAFRFQGKTVQCQSSEFVISNEEEPNALTLPDSLEKMPDPECYLSALGATLWNDSSANLTDYHAQQWAKKAQKTLKNVALTTLISLAITAFFYTQFLQKKEENQPLVASMVQPKKQLADLRQKIERLKQNPQADLSPTFSPERVEFVLSLIQQIPVKSGGLEAVRLYFDEGEKFKLFGKYATQADVQTLQNYLTEQQLSFTMESLQSTENGVEFSLLILFNEEKEDDNETENRN